MRPVTSLHPGPAGYADSVGSSCKVHGLMMVVGDACACSLAVSAVQVGGCTMKSKVVFSSQWLGEQLAVVRPCARRSFWALHNGQR